MTAALGIVCMALGQCSAQAVGGAVVAACLSVQVCYHCYNYVQHSTVMQGEAVTLLSYLGLGWSMGEQGRYWGEQFTGNAGVE